MQQTHRCGNRGSVYILSTVGKFLLTVHYRAASMLSLLMFGYSFTILLASCLLRKKQNKLRLHPHNYTLIEKNNKKTLLLCCLFLLLTLFQSENWVLKWKQLTQTFMFTSWLDLKSQCLTLRDSRPVLCRHDHLVLVSLSATAPPYPSKQIHLWSFIVVLPLSTFPQLTALCFQFTWACTCSEREWTF